MKTTISAIFRVLTDMLMLKTLPVDRSAGDARISLITFIAHVGFSTQELAHMLDSLVVFQDGSNGTISSPKICQGGATRSQVLTHKVQHKVHAAAQPHKK